MSNYNQSKLDDIDNGRVQKWAFIICLAMVIVGVVTIATGNSRLLTNWSTFWNGQWTTKSQPLFIVLIFALAGLWFSGRNLLRLKRNKTLKK